MTDHIIQLAKDYGTDLSNRHGAAALRLEIVRKIDDAGIVVIDFEGVRVVSQSFADELLAVLVEQFGESWFKEHIKVINPSRTVRLSLLEAINLRCRQQHA